MCISASMRHHEIELKYNLSLILLIKNCNKRKHCLDSTLKSATNTTNKELISSTIYKQFSFIIKVENMPGFYNKWQIYHACFKEWTSKAYIHIS